ncbi:hypothetical protein IV203_005376 [Nitzschia inconspicua]|uniref:Uncharacterized protein n=1 Tax=Nitzschia inconspicua TaxID=303405 RepID=A0A9K3KNS0_9STRA|nr:hypothetical protein IV203_005376 [Nitzschia inconspicua]
MSSQVQNKERREQRVKQKSSLKDMLTEDPPVPEEAKQEIEGSSTLKSSDVISTARNLRRLKRRLLILCVQVEPNIQPIINKKKEGVVLANKLPWKTRNRRTNKETFGSDHFRTSSCLF